MNLSVNAYSISPALFLPSFDHENFQNTALNKGGNGTSPTTPSPVTGEGRGEGVSVLIHTPSPNLSPSRGRGILASQMYERCPLGLMWTWVKRGRRDPCAGREEQEAKAWTWSDQRFAPSISNTLFGKRSQEEIPLVLPPDEGLTRSS